MHNMDIVFEPSQMILPGITVTEKWVDGIFSAYRLTAQEGFVMFDQTAKHTTIDPETGKEIPIIYYYRQTTYPARYSPAVWQDRWMAVAENTVAQNQIFGKNV